MDGMITDQRIATVATREAVAFSSNSRVMADQDVHAVAEGDACSGRSGLRGAVLVLGTEDGAEVWNPSGRLERR